LDLRERSSSSSALREGWDNPNVFQICTLNETKSAMKKRQEIGRGMRLPVDQDGKRVFDEAINKLYIMANESYEDFARALQTEYEEDCGVTFGKVPITAIARITRAVDGQEAMARLASVSVSNSTRYVVLGLMRFHNASKSGLSVTSFFRRFGFSSVSLRTWRSIW
jgi:superfamily II DNA or RNA helicase